MLFHEWWKLLQIPTKSHESTFEVKALEIALDSVDCRIEVSRYTGRYCKILDYDLGKKSKFLISVTFVSTNRQKKNQSWISYSYRQLILFDYIYLFSFTQSFLKSCQMSLTQQDSKERRIAMYELDNDLSLNRK